MCLEANAEPSTSITLGDTGVDIRSRGKIERERERERESEGILKMHLALN